MRLHFVTVPVFETAAAEDELNQFLASHRVLAVERALVNDGPRSVWAVCVSYLPAGGSALPIKKGRVDYREVLAPPEFALYARLRNLRKTLAERDGVPPYAVFTNDQLAAIVQRRATTASALGEISGVGKARIERYGEAFLEVVRAGAPAAAGDPDSDAHEDRDGGA